MEYTRSIGDVYETFEGTPEEIAKLLKLMDKSNTLSCSGVIEDEEVVSCQEVGLELRDDYLHLW